MKYLNGDDTRKKGSLSRFGIRRSCDACGRKKKRCDGEQPCSRCVRSESECKYSKRRWHHPGPTKDQQQGILQERDRHNEYASEHLGGSPPDMLLEHGMLPLKRCRLRASPATGLVGMQENVFLSDFFCCIGFLPLTSKSQVRETMVKLMVAANPLQEPAFKTDCFREEEQSCALKGRGVFCDVSGVKPLPKDPSVCTFWSAVALGALAKGSPIESVASYTQLAREALAADHSGSTDAELAKASAILTYLHSFMGETEKFREYLHLSESFLRASMEQGSPDINMGLPDFIQHCRKVCNVQTGITDSCWVEEQAPPQLGKVATEGELYRFIAQSFKAFDNAVFTEARERCGGAAEDFYYAGTHSQISSPNDPEPGEVSGAIAAVFEKSSSPDFEPLQETADRPSIRAGIGGLLINGTLVFEKAAKGDVDATLERLDRSIEVFERYPGLCRCMMESHLSHMLLAMLAKIGDSRARVLYNRLQTTHNLCLPSHSAPIPPLDEWQGMATICSDLHCRAIEDLIKNQIIKPFTKPSADDSDGDIDGLAQSSRNLPGQSQSEIFATSVPHGDPVGSGPASSSCWAESNAPNKDSQSQDPPSTSCCAGPNPASLISPFYASSHSDTEFDSDCSVDCIAARGVNSWPRLAGANRDQTVTADPEEDQIAAADWLEVTYAMMDAVHAS